MSSVHSAKIHRHVHKGAPRCEQHSTARRPSHTNGLLNASVAHLVVEEHCRVEFTSAERMPCDCLATHPSPLHNVLIGQWRGTDQWRAMTDLTLPMARWTISRDVAWVHFHRGSS